MTLSGLLWCATILVTSWTGVTSGACPWDMEDLSPWSEPATWPDNTVPGFESEVNISGRVLLDVSPPNLLTLTVLPGALLVWGDVEGLLLNVSFVHILGGFHIGSEDCRFTKRATINLFGLSNTPYELPHIGQKVVGVGSGGMLEVHGEEKLSWTKLAHTIPASRHLTCGLLYDHQASVLGQEGKGGLHVMVWNRDGSVHDFNVFQDSIYPTLQEFLQTLPDEVVVAAAVRISIQSPTESALQTLEALGSTLVRSVQASQLYAFLVRKGNASSVQEAIEPDDYLRMYDPSRDLEFRVTSNWNGVNFQVVDGEVTRPKITLAHSARSWKVGDKILVTSTDYDWRQAEVKRILDCPDCNNNQIRLDGPFQYSHFGEVTLGVDERAEVALLTRNILFRGQLEEECYAFNEAEQLLCDRFQMDTFGGHVKAIHGSSIHVEGAEFYHMGQQNTDAAYPLHFHMMNDASGMWFRSNSIHHTRARCITIHGTHNSEVSDNVCYLHLGHGYFIEDSVEQNNTLNANLGVGTQHGHLLLSDRKDEWCPKNLPEACSHISTFWLTHPNNIITNNVAAGSDGHGYHYVFADKPLGLSKHKPWFQNITHSKYFPLTFHGNVGHSIAKAGVFFDSVISNGQSVRGVFVPENGVLMISPNYEPRNPPHEHGSHVWTEMTNLTFYKTGTHNLWIKGGNIRVSFSTLADSQRGFSGGTIKVNSGTELTHSLLVAETDNLGEPHSFRDTSISGTPIKQFDRSLGQNPYLSTVGVELYQGPMMVDTCHFSGYRHQWWADEWQSEYGVRPVRPSGAISFPRNNIYPLRPWTYVNNLTFDYCDGEQDGRWVFYGNGSTYAWKSLDGVLLVNFHDRDGSVTGQAGSQVVLDRPLYTGPDCQSRPFWRMAVCPYKYGMLEFVGQEGVLSRTMADKYPLIVQRDDVPDDTLNLEGNTKNMYLVRVNKSYTVNFNSTLGTVPYFVDVRAFGLEKDDILRVGLCFPNDTTQFRIRSDFPNIKGNDPPEFVSSLSELDSDLSGRAFYWDSAAGMLYFKFLTNATRQNNTEECADSLCPRFKITRLDGGNTLASACTNTQPINIATPEVSTPQPKACHGRTGTGEGLGAPISHVVTAPPFGITCRAIDSVPGRAKPEFRGCFKDKSASRDITEFQMELIRSMTLLFCQNRCYNRGYRFAALSLGKQCACGDWFGLHGILPRRRCSYNCTGDQFTTCGGGSPELEVYTTGLTTIKPLPVRCGPNGMGVEFESTCLYLQLQILAVADAQRLCVRLGGNLVAIDTEDKQKAVEVYLREHHPNMKVGVWSGLNHARDPAVWEQRDGAPLGLYSLWKPGHGTDLVKHFVYLSGVDKYAWKQTKDILRAQPLCDLPLHSPPAIEQCGRSGERGVRLEPPGGPCYLVLQDPVTQVEANHACHTARGRLPSSALYHRQLTRLLYLYGREQSYWLSEHNKALTWVNSIYTIKEDMTSSNKAGAVCVIESTNNAQECPPDWHKHGQSCYLSLGAEVKGYTTGASLCEREDGNSNLVTVESESENSFLTNLTGSTNVLLGLRYTPRYDDFTWRNGDQTTSFSAWSSGNGKTNLIKGSCAVLQPSTGDWANAKCISLVARVICEMPLVI